MYPIPGRCPVCGDVLEVTRLHCRQCDTSIEGHFFASRLSRLTAEQMQFVEVFLQCEGTIKRVEKEMGISYPTVRSRLEDVIHAMGFEVLSNYQNDSSTLNDAHRSEVLDKLDRGEISSSEALELLQGD